MASSKRSLSDFYNKDEFAFNIVNGIIDYPKLYSKINKSNNIRYWYIYCVLMNKNTKIQITNELIDIETFKEFEKENNYKNLKIYIYTEYGQINGKITETEPTIVDVGKNVNKKNETSIITQSLISMRNLYLKKIKTGYSLDLEQLETKPEANATNEDNVYPMAVHEYGKHKQKIKFWCYGQYKLDGIRIIAKYDEKTDIVTFLSRNLNQIFGFDNIKNQIKLIFELNPKIILDGEFYLHNLQLQEISGIVRHQDVNLKEKIKLIYYVFDYIDLHNEVTFEERINNLEDMFKQVKKNNNLENVKLLDTYVINNEKEGDKLFNKALKEKYEGIIYKNKNALYEYSTIKTKRSYQYIKRKAQFDSEYKIVDYESGTKGKDLGAIIMIMCTKSGDQFRAVPNASLEERKKMFKLAEKDFNNIYKGKFATIKYDDVSKNGIPLRSKFITIRDYE